MKMNPRKKSYCFCILLFFVVLIATITFLCFQPANSTEDLLFNIRREVFFNYDKSEQIETDRNSIEIHFPQISGLNDKNKEETVNRLIEYDAKKFLQNNVLFNEKNLYLHLNYENIFISKSVISIFYKGDYGATYNPGRGLYWEVMGTTIDLETAEIITLNDLVTDPDALYDLLLEGKFEAISTWDGIKGNYSIDMFHSGISRDTFKDALSNYFDISNHCLEWYTDGENFVIVIIDKYYYEYSIKIEEVKEILNLDLLS